MIKSIIFIYEHYNCVEKCVENMNINITKAQINFGWSCETHRVIMETAIKDMPQFTPFKDK